MATEQPARRGTERRRTVRRQDTMQVLQPWGTHVHVLSLPGSQAKEPVEEGNRVCVSFVFHPSSMETRV